MILQHEETGRMHSVKDGGKIPHGYAEVWCAELEQLKNNIRVIDALIEGYVDGAPDASAASKLANQIHHIIHPIL